MSDMLDKESNKLSDEQLSDVSGGAVDYSTGGDFSELDFARDENGIIGQGRWALKMLGEWKARMKK